MPSFRWSFLAVGLLVACGGGGDGGGGGPAVGSLTLNDGDDQVAEAGTVLPDSLSVLVRDNAGAALPGVSVGWAVTLGGGNVSPGSSISDAGGIARTRRTLGPNAGTQTARASFTGETPVDFSAIAQIQGAVNIVNATPPGALTDTVGATSAESLVVTVTDHLAAPVAGVQVNWASTGGAVSAAQDATDAAGESRVEYTYGTGAGDQTATATVTGLVGSPVIITLAATAGTATQIAKTAGDGGMAAPSSQVSYTVQSRDTHGNPKGGVVIDWAVATGGGSIAPPQNTTGTNGTASATRTLSATLGAQTATATANALPGTPAVTFTTNVVQSYPVSVSNDQFTPENRTIPVGSTVIWEWQGITSAHNVTFTTAGAPANISDRSDGSISRQFNATGVFNYECTNHPPGMTGSVTVNP
ncbi:MAG: plastocyanin/azurin family copper-binding protein [Gemmatimonadales bacterium]